MFSYYSQYGTIIRGFKKHKTLQVSFFQKGSFYVGYKANSRICELVKDGYLRRSPIDTIGSKGQHFANYELTAKGFNLSIPEPTFTDKLLHYIF